MTDNISPEIVSAFNDGLAPSDVVTRTAPDPDALEALRGMVGRRVTFRDFEMTEQGLREVETEAVLYSVDGWKSPPNAA